MSAAASPPIRLRPVVESDFPIFFAYLQDDTSARMAAFGTRDPNVEALAARWARAAQSPRTVARTILVEGGLSGGERGAARGGGDEGRGGGAGHEGRGHDATGGECAGFVSTFAHGDETHVTYWVARSYWGRGIASAALRELLTIVKERPLHASIAKDNVGSRRVLEKCGFRKCGVTPAFSDLRGEDVDEVFFELTASPLSR